MWKEIVFVAGIALANGGCAEQLQLLDRGPTAGASPCSFWPPPPGSATWVLESSATEPAESLASLARELEQGLRVRGYAEQRWYPIGADSSHGFAVTTRLEQFEDAAGREPRERWSSRYADGAELRWLMQARTPSLPQPGSYRVFLVAYTDLPIGSGPNAPIWNDETLMDWPNAAHSSSSRDSVPARTVAGYRLGIYEYEYMADDPEARGRLRPADAVAAIGAEPPPPSLLRQLGLFESSSLSSRPQGPQVH